MWCCFDELYLHAQRIHMYKHMCTGVAEYTFLLTVFADRQLVVVCANKCSNTLAKGREEEEEDSTNVNKGKT